METVTRKQHICELCTKEFRSTSNLNYHIRERHSHSNTEIIKCELCENSFHCIKQKDKYVFKKCESCRELRSKLKTGNLINNSFVYGVNKERYFIEKGVATRVCSVYTCENTVPCNLHCQDNLIECKKTKCNNCFVPNGKKYCERCSATALKSNNKQRIKVLEFKKELGGKCVDCGFDELFYLEFDHVDPSKKSVQITKSVPSEWIKEKDNLELRCGRCHRIKSRDQLEHDKNNNKNRANKKNKIFTHEVKKAIGGCQICNWKIEDKSKMCAALDFDHVTDDKLKQVSDLYHNKSLLIEEIKKTRILCRHCHELNTCIQRGGVSLQFYFSSEKIEELKGKLECQESIERCRQEVERVLNEILAREIEV